LLSAVSPEQFDFVKAECEKLFEKAFEKGQSSEKIDLLFDFMIEEDWTCKQAVDAVKHFLKNKITYYDKWIIPDILAFPAGKCFTGSKKQKLCTDGGRVHSDFIRFKGADGDIYYWDKNFGKCPFPEEKQIVDKWFIIDNEKINESRAWFESWGEIPEGWVIRKDDENEIKKLRDIESLSLMLKSFSYPLSNEPEIQKAKIHSINEDLYRELRLKGIYPESETPEELRGSLEKVIFQNKTYFITIKNQDEPVEKILAKFLEDFKNSKQVI